MSSLIQTVSFEAAQAKDLRSRLLEHVGLHPLHLVLEGGTRVTGVLAEVGQDHLILLEEQNELLLPLAKIQLIRYQRQKA